MTSFCRCDAVVCSHDASPANRCCCCIQRSALALQLTRKVWTWTASCECHVQYQECARVSLSGSCCKRIAENRVGKQNIFDSCLAVFVVVGLHVGLHVGLLVFSRCLVGCIWLFLANCWLASRTATRPKPMRQCSLPRLCWLAGWHAGWFGCACLLR